MAKVATFLGEDIIKNLKELEPNKALSKVISEVIDIGYRVKLHQKNLTAEEKGKAILTDKHTDYLLRILATTADIYRCIRNNKSKYSEETADDALGRICTNTQNFINKMLSESQ